jgi:hypothetical protein
VAPRKLPLDVQGRDKLARRVLQLCKEKGYRLETWLIAINILDRFLHLGAGQFLDAQRLTTNIPVIAATVTIIAAKLEQPMTPSIKRMIVLLTPEEEQHVDKQAVIEMEGIILREFSCDFVFLSPQPFLERFLRLLDHELTLHTTELSPPSQYLHPLAVDLLKFTFSKAELLWGRLPSLLAAAILCGAHRLLRSLLVGEQAELLRWLSLHTLWTPKMVELTGISLDEFEGYAKSIEQAY